MHLQCWAELAGEHGIVAVEVTSDSDARGLPNAVLSPVLDAWRMTQDLPVMSAATVLEAAASVGLVPQSGFAACCYSRHGSRVCMLCVYVGGIVCLSAATTILAFWQYATRSGPERGPGTVVHGMQACPPRCGLDAVQVRVL